MRFYNAPKGYTKVDEQHTDIEDGAPVYINPMYLWEDEKPKKYCVCSLGDNHYLIADTKKELNEGRGHIYDIWSISYYKNFD